MDNVGKRKGSGEDVEEKEIVDKVGKRKGMWIRWGRERKCG